LTDGVGTGRRNELALESFEGGEIDGCKDDGETGCESCVDVDDAGESVAFCEADANGVE
jgi:hypothetical protein